MLEQEQMLKKVQMVQLEMKLSQHDHDGHSALVGCCVEAG